MKKDSFDYQIFPITKLVVQNHKRKNGILKQFEKD